ncbi:MAG: hypothetical protein GY757_52875 [bacterium]|nr:hypothetical protein [bacterium]
MNTLNEYRLYADRKEKKTLSLAVELVDDYSGGPPVGKAAVIIEETQTGLARNRSGYYLYIDAPKGEYKLRVTAEYYFEATATVKLPRPDPKNPVVEITMKPLPSYPFPPGATLIRGQVENKEGKPVPGAKVNVIGKDLNNTTTVRGEYVLYFTGLTEENIHMEKNRRLVTVNGKKTIRLEAAKEQETGKTQVKEVEECRTTALKKPIILSKP